MIAVAGATGYIGGLLCARLREQGRDLRALARRPQRSPELERIGCDVRAADVLDPATLSPALEGVDVAYYLVHSMGRGSDGDFAARDHAGAENFSAAAEKAGVRGSSTWAGWGRGPSTSTAVTPRPARCRRATSRSPTSAPRR